MLGRLNNFALVFVLLSQAATVTPVDGFVIGLPYLSEYPPGTGSAGPSVTKSLAASGLENADSDESAVAKAISKLGPRSGPSSVVPAGGATTKDLQITADVIPDQNAVQETVRDTRNRTRSPVYNIWEYAAVAGPTNVRHGGPPASFQQDHGGLNRCEWAIVSCCVVQSLSRRHACFEALHCAGAWFENPCTDSIQAAIFSMLLSAVPQNEGRNNEFRKVVR